MLDLVKKNILQYCLINAILSMWSVSTESHSWNLFVGQYQKFNLTLYGKICSCYVFVVMIEPLGHIN